MATPGVHQLAAPAPASVEVAGSLDAGSGAGLAEGVGSTFSPPAGGPDSVPAEGDGVVAVMAGVALGETGTGGGGVNRVTSSTAVAVRPPLLAVTRWLPLTRATHRAAEQAPSGATENTVTPVRSPNRLP